MPASIAVVGITDAGVDSLLPEARAAVAAAEVLCGGERHLSFFPEHPGERWVIKSGLEALYQRLEVEVRPVAVLASGDPMWYGIGPLLTRRLGQPRVQVYPNLSAGQLAFARLGLPWQDAAFLSAHGRPLDGILPAALSATKAVVLTDDENTPAAIAARLLAAGSDDAEAHVFEHLGGPAERHTATTLTGLAGREFAALNLLVVLRPRAARRWALGLPDDAYAHARGLITKAEVRAVSLAKLGLRATDTVWDVGAGCGSVAIEAAGLARRGRVCAIERDATQLAYLQQNRTAFGSGNLQVVAGEAPDALTALPDPDAVFIGGSGGNLGAILSVCFDRLNEGGHIVLNQVSLEHLGETLAVAKAAGWASEVTHLSTSRSTETAGLVRLAAQNPVFIITLSRAGA